jgi:hypothetical protein
MVVTLHLACIRPWVLSPALQEQQKTEDKLMPVIVTTQVAEIRRITVQSQPGQILPETLSQKTHHKKRTGGVAQVVGPEFKPQHHKINK